MLNINLSYKPPSSWMIFFRSGGHPRQFSCLKRFRDLVVPGGSCRKVIILQWSQLPSGLLVIGQSLLQIKGGVTGASVHTPIQRNSTYWYPTLVPLEMPYFRVLRSYSEVGRTAVRTSVLKPATSRNDVALIYHNSISTYVTNI